MLRWVFSQGRNPALNLPPSCHSGEGAPESRQGGNCQAQAQKEAGSMQTASGSSPNKGITQKGSNLRPGDGAGGFRVPARFAPSLSFCRPLRGNLRPCRIVYLSARFGCRGAPGSSVVDGKGSVAGGFGFGTIEVASVALKVHGHEDGGAVVVDLDPAGAGSISYKLVKPGVNPRSRGRRCLPGNRS